MSAEPVDELESASGRPPGPGTRRDTPFGVGIPLGRWAGVPIHAHWSVVVTLVLFADLLASVELPAARPGETTAGYWLIGTVTAAVFLVTLLAHELAHAVTARHYRMRVRRITLWMLGGLTELDGEPPSPRADALIAASGPLTSLGIGAVSAGFARWAGDAGLVGTALGWLAGISVLLGVFNLFPGAPLDGGRLLRALLWWRGRDRARAADQAAQVGRLLGIALITLGFLDVLVGDVAGLWLVLIGWFIVGGASTERYAARGEQLSGLTVGDVMTRTPAVVPDWWTVAQFLDQLPPELAGQPAFPLLDIAGQVTGLVTAPDLERVRPGSRQTTRLREVRTRGHAPVVAPATLVSAVLLSLHLRGGIAVVVDNSGPVGIVTHAELARASRLAALGWSGDKTPEHQSRDALDR